MVQGVGFRYTTRRIANRFAVTGYVRNLPDGRVRAVAEGRAAEVERFFGAVEAELGHFIRHKEQTIAAPTGEFGIFDIRF